MEYEVVLKKIEKRAIQLAVFLNKSKIIRHISHLDADGLSSAGLIDRILLKYNKPFHTSIIKQLEKPIVDQLLNETYDTYLFTDLGSGQLEELKPLIEKARVIIVDHHPPATSFEHPNLIQINAHELGLDGNKEASASTIAFFVAKCFDLDDAEHLPVIGSVGDAQEENGDMIGLNKYLLSTLEKVQVDKGLRIFGRVSKPLHRALAHTTEPFIPGVSGDESLAIQFLAEIGIEIKDGENWRTLDNLTDEEQKMLTTNIIMRRLNNAEKPDDVFGNVYSFKNKEDLLADAREFATLLNSTGRQGYYSIGLMICMGEEKDALIAAKKSMDEYKRKLLKALNYVETVPESVVKTDEAVFIIGNNKIDDTIIGTVCSILSQSKSMDRPTIIGFAKSDNGLKVSARTFSKKIDIGELITSVAEKVGGEGGGHKGAGGAKIPLNTEQQFIEEFNKTIKVINTQKIADKVN